VTAGGRGTIEDNDIVANEYAGIEVRDRGSPIVRANRINDNKYEAIWVHKGGGGTFEANDLRRNAQGPWEIDPECEANVKLSENIEN
jgi:F-box protein 11